MGIEAHVGKTSLVAKDEEGRRYPLIYELGAARCVYCGFAKEFGGFLLSPGRYEYRFFADGESQNDPNCSSVVEDPLALKISSFRLSKRFPSIKIPF